MKKLKQTTEAQSVSPATLRSVKALIQYAFTDMLRLLNAHQTLTTREATPDEIRSFKQNSVMFTVSSSHFRLVTLIHYPACQSLTEQQTEHFRSDFGTNAQQYRDYVCELGNNLCGVVCRVLGADGFPTGMSTPALLNIMNSAGHLRRTEPSCEAHMASFTEHGPLLSTTFSLFFNHNARTDLVLNVPNIEEEDESLGELEFF